MHSRTHIRVKGPGYPKALVSVDCADPGADLTHPALSMMWKVLDMSGQCSVRMSDDCRTSSMSRYSTVPLSASSLFGFTSNAMTRQPNPCTIVQRSCN